jgi:hypothetical protein
MLALVGRPAYRANRSAMAARAGRAQFAFSVRGARLAGLATGVLWHLGGLALKLGLLVSQ